MMHVILMGPQGAGKGTQSERVRSHLNLAPIATGELFRAAINQRTDLGRQVQAIYDRGELVPDALTVSLVEERLDQLSEEQVNGVRVAGALYDGFPRTEAQADALDDALAARNESLSAVVAIDVPRDKLVRRLSNRRVCPSCGRVYNLESDPPTLDGICNVCGARLIQRADDTPASVLKRLELHAKQTAPLEQRFARRGLLVHIDGDRPVDAVTESILSAIAAKSGFEATTER
jgi:adenylate kinase